MDKTCAQGALIASLLSASLAAHAASLYDFNGTLTDSLGSGPAMTDHGGSVVAGDYVFGPNQGLSLDWSGFDAASYDITLRFSFTSVGSGASWRKIVDFKGRSTDEGLYSFNDHLQFVETAGSSSVENFINSPFTSFVADQPLTLRITRDAGSQLFSAFINDVEELSFVDSNGRATFSSGVANFFLDDIVTSGEFSAGRAELIAIGPTPVPLPASLPLLAIGIGLLGRRTKRCL